jgi:lipid-A-disaccharide synthase
MADAIEKWLSDADACMALADRFTALHHELRQGTAERAARVVLPYLQDSVSSRETGSS